MRKREKCEMRGRGRDKIRDREKKMGERASVKGEVRKRK
jgi:hypothetical protein